MSLAETLGLALIAIALVHGALTLFALWRWREGTQSPSTVQPPVSLLKPLHGADPLLEGALRSCFEQDYPNFQIVFGVREANDAALPIVERLRVQYPQVPCAVVINPTLHGSNRKVSNLINLFPAAQHDWLVLADSDIHVRRDYLATVTAPLHDARSGIVTCLYRGRSARNLWSRLGALYISDWFMPSVLLAQLLGRRNFAFGATIALRRSVLKDIGGFEAIRDHLADDFMLSDLVRKRGLETILSHTVVETTVAEADFAALARHELRWLRTNRFLEPLGHAFVFLTFTLPLVALGLALASNVSIALPMATFAVATRFDIHLIQRRRSGRSAWCTLWLVPLRDTLTALLWLSSFFSRRVVWGEQRLRVARDGSFEERRRA